MTNTKTCIVCGRQFSTHNGVQNRPQTKVCSPECRRKWASIRHHGLYIPKRGGPKPERIKAYQPRKGITVTAKCPACGIYHDVMMDKRPIVTPRIYCRIHEWCREALDYL